MYLSPIIIWAICISASLLPPLSTPLFSLLKNFIFHNCRFFLWSADGSFSPGWGNEQNVSYFCCCLKLHCDQTVWFFQVFSTVLKRLCPLLTKKNTFVYPSKKFWSPVQHPCFCPIEQFLGNLFDKQKRIFLNVFQQYDLNGVYHEKADVLGIPKML